MAHSPAPQQLDGMGGRTFSFYPPIVGVEHNEWTFLEGRWSEVLVRNAKTGVEVWIPRTYVGEISKIDEPVMIVGLKRELEYKTGAVWPHSRRVISMPSNPASRALATDEPSAPGPSPISELRLGGAESKIGKAILLALVAGVGITFFLVSYFRIRETGGAIEYQGVPQADLGFSAQSTVGEVTGRLGQPDRDQWASETGERQIRMLTFNKDGLVVFFMGSERDTVRYIGSKDTQWRTVHTVKLPGGGDTGPILRSLKRP